MESSESGSLYWTAILRVSLHSDEVFNLPHSANAMRIVFGVERAGPCHCLDIPGIGTFLGTRDRSRGRLSMEPRAD